MPVCRKTSVCLIIFVQDCSMSGSAAYKGAFNTHNDSESQLYQGLWQVCVLTGVQIASTRAYYETILLTDIIFRIDLPTEHFSVRLSHPHIFNVGMALD